MPALERVTYIGALIVEMLTFVPFTMYYTIIKSLFYLPLFYFFSYPSLNAKPIERSI